MVYQCDACNRIYELGRTDVRCIYCGACRCHPVERPEGEPKEKKE